MSWARKLLALGAALAALMAMAEVAGMASADGDPASDVLLAANVFYPYSPPVSASLQKSLDAVTTAAQRVHFPIKVALIHSPVDLGAIPELFGKPQPYANFLDQEISFLGVKQLLLVVMPDGFGVRGLDPAATAAVASLPKPTGASANALAQAAISAVSKLAAAAGHPIRTIGNASAASSGNTSTLPILIGVVVVALAGAGGVILFRRRQPLRRS